MSFEIEPKNGRTVITDLATIKSEVLNYEWGDCGGCTVRILDQAEIHNVEWGKNFTLQVYSQIHGDFLDCRINGNYVMSLTAIYKLLRVEFKYQGPLRVAVAAAP